MVSISSITISSSDLTSLLVSWEFEETWESLDPYTLNIYRSNNPTWGSDFTLLVSGIDPTDTISYEDTSVSGYLHNMWNDFYYTVVPVTPFVSGAIYTPQRLETSMNLVAKEIIRRKNLALLPRYGGQPFSFLKRKKSGSRCTNCWDTVIQRRTKENCEVCYDTSWVGGYFPATTFYGSIGGAPRRTLINLFGEWEQQDTYLKLSSKPLMSPQDIVVDSQNRRWRVVDVQPIEKNQYIVTQQIRLSRISTSDIVYKYAING